MVKPSLLHSVQTTAAVVVIVLCLVKLVDSLGRPSGEFLYRWRSGYVERWQEQIVLVAALCGTSWALMRLLRNGRSE